MPKVGVVALQYLAACSEKAEPIATSLRVKMSRATHFICTAGLPQYPDMTAMLLFHQRLRDLARVLDEELRDRAEQRCVAGESILQYSNRDPVGFW